MRASSCQISHSHITFSLYFVVSFTHISTHRYVHSNPFIHTHTSSAVNIAIPYIPQHKQQHLITRKAVRGRPRINFCDVTLSALLHCCSCWDLLHWQVQGAGPVLQGRLRQAICQWTHTHRHTPPSARQTDNHVRVFPQCRGGLLCKQLAWLSSPEKHTPVQSPRWSSSLSHATELEVCVEVCECVGVSDRNSSVVKYFTPVVNLFFAVSKL